MRKVQINGAARRAIRNHASRTFHETAAQVGPDLWEVSLEDQTVEALDKWRERLDLKSYSDVILWLAAKHGPGPH